MIAQVHSINGPHNLPFTCAAKFGSSMLVGAGQPNSLIEFNL